MESDSMRTSPARLAMVMLVMTIQLIMAQFVQSVRTISMRSSENRIIAIVFAFFFFIVILVNVLIPEMIALAGTTITALSAGTQALIGIISLVMVAILIYALYKHGMGR